MKKIVDYKNEDALDLIADLVEPASEIMADEELRELMKSKTATRAYIAKRLIKNKKKRLLDVLAVLDGVTVEELDYTPYMILNRVLEVLSDKELMSFFSSLAADT